MLASLASCARTPTRPDRQPSGPTIELHLLCSVPQTRLYFDGRLVPDRCGPEGLRLATTAGAHRIEARHEGFFAELRDLELATKPKPVELMMRAVPSLVRTELEADAPP